MVSRVIPSSSYQIDPDKNFSEFGSCTRNELYILGRAVALWHGEWHPEFLPFRSPSVYERTFSNDGLTACASDAPR